MNILCFFRRKKNCYNSYKQSSHVPDYERIACELGTNAQHVYEIAHGKTIADFDDYVIYKRLRLLNIIM